MTDDELLREVLITPRHAFVPMPDTRVVERPGWMQIITPSLATGGMNEVCLAVLAPDEADRIIDETLASYRDAGIRFRWSIGPDSAPADLDDRLRTRGLQPETVLGLACTIDELDQGLPASVSVEPVTEANLADFTLVMAKGWSMDAAPLLDFHRRILELEPERFPMHLARYDGQPAGAAAASSFPRSAYLMGAVVLPEYRGCGLYRALVSSRAREATRRGITLMTAHARATTSAPILARLGFREVCRLTMWADPVIPSPSIA